MGQWSDVNTRETWWERHTGRPSGFEDRTAKIRRGHRDVYLSDGDDPPDGLPSTLRPGRRLSDRELKRMDRQAAADKRKARKDIEQLKALKKRLERELAAAEAAKKQIAKIGNRPATQRATKEVKARQDARDEIVRQLKRRGAA